MRTVTRCLTILALLLPSGCGTTRFHPTFAGRDVVASTASKDEVVALVNRNITGSDRAGGLMSWKCLQASFKVSPIPGRAPGTIIVEAPRGFRLRVANPIGGADMLDVGSNTDEFWIWQKQMNPPYLLTAHHEDMPIALQHFKVPFQPDWIMEVLGVIPVDGAQYDLHPTPGKPYMELAASSVAPGGEPMRKVIRVDTRRGWVTEYLLWGASGKMVASAELSDHKIDPSTNIVMPRKIRIRWPEADLDLQIALDHVEINPTELPPGVWEIPQKSGFKRLDMGEFARQHSAGREIQYVEHQEPTAPARQPPPAGVGLGGPAPFPESSQGSASATGAPAFPGDSTPVMQAALTQPDRSIPVRDDSSPLGPPGRARVGFISP